MAAIEDLLVVITYALAVVTSVDIAVDLTARRATAAELLTLLAAVVLAAATATVQAD